MESSAKHELMRICRKIDNLRYNPIGNFKEGVMWLVDDLQKI